ncbi:GxxExxY protein [Echinicola marina]|uniref:GxxExxY protein n=1 Tax=Echinicola marina TaxID=2859768 RepID=UPI001CF62771|nr:GxxExxY protein [Echinicola marina]UCS93544.1 GxxExxY protein [Echinicola marina]
MIIRYHSSKLVSHGFHRFARNKISFLGAFVCFLKDYHTKSYCCNCGYTYLEHVYQECLFYKLKSTGMLVEKEVGLPVVFEEVKIECGYRLDLLVENKVVIELKSVETLNDIHLAQTLTYLKLGHYKLGLLMNFNVLLLKNGIRRVINGDL